VSGSVELAINKESCQDRLAVVYPSILPGVLLVLTEGDVIRLTDQSDIFYLDIDCIYEE